MSSNTTGTTALDEQRTELFAATFDKEAWDYYERLREAGEVIRDDAQGLILVTSYDLAKQISVKDHEAWRSAFVYDDEHPPFGMTRDEWTEFNGAGNITSQEGAVYDRMHRWFFRVFSPKVLELWGETLVEPIANSQIDRFADEGRAELVNALCDRVTPRVMTAILGLPWNDESWFDRFVALHRSVIVRLTQYQFGTVPDRELIDGALGAMREMRAMVMPTVEARQGAPGDDMISLIWRAGEDLFGDREPTTLDVTVQALTSFLAGSGSVATLIGNSIYMLATHPAIAPELAESDTKLRSFVEESARLYGQIEFRPRRAKHDLVLGGTEIKRGELVLVLTAAANRDPAHYGCPASLDLDRSSPRDHFAFFMGPRTCPGQSLARFQVQRTLKVVVDRLKELRLDPDAPQPEWRGAVVRRWEPLHCVFKA